jgi:hypothetical protein
MSGDTSVELFSYNARISAAFNGNQLFPPIIVARTNYEETAMAQAAWKRPGSPIGKTGPRKAHPKYQRQLGEAWMPHKLSQLKSLAKQNTPTGVLSLKLGRPPTAIRSKAQREGISLRPTNRSPYSRRKR